MIRVCPHSDSRCRNGMGCTFSCATGDYDGTKRPMTQPLPETNPMTDTKKTEGCAHEAWNAHAGTDTGNCVDCGQLINTPAHIPDALSGGEPVATWHKLDDEGGAELRVRDKRITSFPSYSGAQEAAERINTALRAAPDPLLEGAVRLLRDFAQFGLNHTSKHVSRRSEEFIHRLDAERKG